MNLDKTQTLAQGIFKNNTDDLSQAISLTGEEGTYSASKLYISSLEPSQSIPDYSLTYKFYDFNSELYETLNNSYILSSVNILTSANSSETLKITGKQTYLQLIYINNVDNSSTRTFNIELTSELGYSTPKHSYPYDLEGLAVVSDSTGTPQHIYTNNSSSYTVQEGTAGNKQTRLYSSTINPTADPNGKGDIVTQEGLYIFKRTYTNINESELGNDQMIIYRVYYIDRTGIINVTTNNSIAENLLTPNFGFV